MLSCEIFKVFKNTFFYSTSPVAASEPYYICWSIVIKTIYFFMRRVVVAAQSFLVFSCFPYVILTSYDFGISGSSHQRCSVKKGVLRHLAKFTGKHLCSSIFFNKVAGLRSATLLKKGLWRRCFPVNFAKLLRTPFLQNTSERLLLKYSILPRKYFYKFHLVLMSVNLTTSTNPGTFFNKLLKINFIINNRQNLYHNISHYQNIFIK